MEKFIFKTEPKENKDVLPPKNELFINVAELMDGIATHLAEGESIPSSVPIQKIAEEAFFVKIPVFGKDGKISRFYMAINKSSDLNEGKWDLIAFEDETRMKKIEAELGKQIKEKAIFDQAREPKEAEEWN